MLAQAIVFFLYMLVVMGDSRIFQKVRLWKFAGFRHYKEVIRIGFPGSIQNIIFSAISMIIARLIAGWGDAAVAVQKVGSQIESISWMTADGFASAVNAFTAQKFWSGKKGENSPRILYCGWDHHSVGNLYKFSFNLYSAGVFPNFYHRGRYFAYGCGLSENYRIFTVVYVYGNHVKRSVQGLGRRFFLRLRELF